MRLLAHDLISRPFGEVVDDLLVAVAGGVVNEPIRFDVKGERYPLAEPSKGVRSITGIRQGEHFVFQNEVDFTFETGNFVVWTETGTRPDDDTIFYVDYFRELSSSPLSDLNVGSVTRTLSEAIAREISFLYLQINRAYLSAFLDTAEGPALDLVVSILGIERKTSEFAQGLVTFFRDPATADGNVTIGENVLLRTAKGQALFTTTQPRTLQRGQVRIDVPVRAAQGSEGPVGEVDAGTISELVQSITGISRVTNFDPMTRAASDETDDELRARARAVVRGFGSATLGALKRVIAEQRAELVEYWDPNNEPSKRSDPGTLSLLLGIKPGRFDSVRGVIDETRAAGVLVDLLARYVFMRPRLTATVEPGLTAAGKLKVQRQISDAFRAYTETLGEQTPAVSTELVKFVMEAKLDGKPNPYFVAEVKLLGFHDVIVERADLSAATSARTFDQNLLKNLKGEKATGTDLDAGNFQVVTPTEAGWFVVLDMDPVTDIQLVEG